MKYIVLLGDGMADHPLDACDGKTAIEAAHTPNMDRIAAMGCCGLFYPIPEGMPPGSDVGNLSVFGYDPRVSFSGRAAIEAVNQGIHLADDEVAFRCNLVTLANGIMQDFTSGHITNEEAAAIIETCNETLANEFPITFHAGVSYRHTGVMKESDRCTVADLVATVCEPPHNITDQEYEQYLPAGPAEALLREMMIASERVLASHPVNEARRAAGKPAATALWPWGQGRALTLTSYQEMFGVTGAVISAVDLVKGIGCCAGLEPLNVPGATGWIDTNYEGKVAAALNALNRHDFVYLHVEAPDEASHQGDVALKIQAIEEFDTRIVAPFLLYLETRPETRLLVAPDHFTLISTKTHAGGAAPFAVCGHGIAPDNTACYGENEASRSGIRVQDGFRLMHHFIREHPLALQGAIE